MFHLTYNVHTFNKRGIKKKDAYELEMAAIVKKKNHYSSMKSLIEVVWT